MDYMVQHNFNVFNVFFVVFGWVELNDIFFIAAIRSQHINFHCVDIVFGFQETGDFTCIYFRASAEHDFEEFFYSHRGEKSTRFSSRLVFCTMQCIHCLCRRIFLSQYRLF